MRADLPSEIAAHLLFHGLRAVMVIGALAWPEWVEDARSWDEIRHLLVSYLRPRDAD